MPKSKKKAMIEQFSSSFGSLSSQKTHNSSISSRSSSENEYREQMPRLSKKQLLEVVKLQKKIKEQQNKLKLIAAQRTKSLRKEVKQKKRISEKHLRNKSPDALLGFLKTQKQEESMPIYEQKIYLTGFDQRISPEILKAQVKQLLAPFKGMCQYKMKTKPEPSYTIILFQSEDLADKVAKILKNVKVFGKQITVLNCKDKFKKDEEGKGKTCYQCQQYGHFGRKCPIRLYRQSNALKFMEESTAEPDSRPITVKKQQLPVDQQIGKQFRDRREKSKRIVRDKTRLHKIISDDM